MAVMMSPQRTKLIEVDHVSKSFPSADGSTLTVLDDVSVTLHDGEVLAILGKSGSGKSTLLRTMAGLIGTTTGQVRYRGTPLNGANPGVGMVFQSFALMPWLTVQENVELGLRAAGVPERERTARALEAIDAIGLDGFETAYPRELSGGMRQRVGFARAFVLRPDVLLMDEPFSALDVLTTENLRGELMDLWTRPDFPTKSICIVTHNIEEAVLLADRVLVLGSNPGHVKAEVPIHLPRPRDRRTPTFETMVDRL
jgi:NitT/TauT family transport system ATP-binding protein